MRGGAGTALVGDPETVAARMTEYMELGIEAFILSGYPHLEECYRFAELVFPLLPLKATTGRERKAVRNAGPFGEMIGQRDPARAAGQGRLVRPLRAAADRLTPWFLPVGLVLAWEAASRLGLLSARVLPAPSDTARAFWDTLASGVLLEHVAASTQRAVIGLAVGGSLGFFARAAERRLPGRGARARSRRCRCCATSRTWRSSRW